MGVCIVVCIESVYLQLPFIFGLISLINSEGKQNIISCSLDLSSMLFDCSFLFWIFSISLACCALLNCDCAFGIRFAYAITLVQCCNGYIFDTITM